MFKVTKELIKQRQPHCEMPVHLTKVRDLGGGILNNCYGNSHKLKKSDDNYFMVSGWVVLPYKKEEGFVRVVQHWFNVNLQTKEYVDTSPVEEGAEYVVDMDLYEYCTKHNDELASHVAASLIYENEKFKLVRQFDIDNQIVSEIDSLATDNLYEFSLIKNR